MPGFTIFLEMLRAKTVLNGENNSTMNLDFLTTGRQIMAQKALIMTGLLLFFVHKTVFGTHQPIHNTEFENCTNIICDKFSKVVQLLFR